MNLKEKWEELNKGYEDITNEVMDKGLSIIGSFIFFTLFVFGFIYVINIGNDGFDISSTFEIVFNWSLVGYSFLVSCVAFVFFLISKNLISKGFLIRAFETTLSLIFICLAGYSMREVDLPFLNPDNKLGFLFLVELIVFAFLWIFIKFLVCDTVSKKQNVLFVLGLVNVFFLISFIVSVVV